MYNRGQFMPDRDATLFVITILILFLSIGLHEFAHAKVADSAGDPTPRIYGRVTLNLFKHFDPFGFIMILVTSYTGFGIGWGRPVPCDPRKMRNPKWDHFLTVAAGPITNILLAAVFALLFHLSVGMQWTGAYWIAFLLLGVVINLSLAVFNLIPLGPLDGHWLVGAFLPERSRYAWYRWNQTTGTFLLLGLVLFGQINPSLNVLGKILRPVTNFFMNLFVLPNFLTS